VLWLGVSAGRPELASAHSELGTRLKPYGFVPEDRPYSAHLTVARVKSPIAAGPRAEIRDALASAGAEAGSCRIEWLTVYRSRTSPKGAVYEPVLRVPLS